MISFDKFRSLTGSTFFKKSSLLISQDIASHIKLDDRYIDEIINKLYSTFPEDNKVIGNIRDRIKNESLLTLKDFIDSKFGKINADLDFITDSKEIDKKMRQVKERYLVLDDLRSPYNFGSIVRSAESFFIKEIIVLSEHLTVDHPNAIRSACRTLNLVECKIFKSRQEGIGYIKSLKLPIFSLECSDNDISSFKFPDRAVAIIGNEEIGVSQELLDMSDNIVGIKMFGAKGSISVSCASAIMLYEWSKST